MVVGRSGSDASLDWAEAGSLCLEVAKRHSASAADAQDAAQEALLRAWRAAERCRSALDPGAYVAAIARNEALRLLDRRARLAEVPMDYEQERTAEDRSLHSVDQRSGLAGALAHLSEHERQLLFLRYVEDLTQPRIARTLGIPEGTVKVQLHRARRKLRQIVEAPPEGW
ncbi:MAG: sigma-70 family RNA polymerase sigma factor [Actinomycetota bacterium]|nr:sigma-70 family RNA polymerase sigma factor [Actinomycetota bacterium]